MSVKTDETGRRSIEVSIEVPCTPEEVWETVATGPGISAWFMAMEMPEGVADTVCPDVVRGGGIRRISNQKS